MTLNRLGCDAARATLRPTKSLPERRDKRWLSRVTAAKSRDTAVVLGYFPRIMPMPLIGGGTDAALFEMISIKPVSIIEMPVRGISEGSD